MKLSVYIAFAAATVLAACGSSDNKHDASGSFEADETIVSAEVSGRITSLEIDEGDTVGRQQLVGTIDATNLELQKEQVQASMHALNEKTATAVPQVKLLQEQIRVQQSQLNNLYHEKQRTENLVKADAAPRKQLDDINAQIDLVQKQIDATRQQIRVQQNNVATQNRGILSEKDPLRKRVAQLEDQIQRANILNPVQGTVIAKYAENGEITSAGKPLYKVADLANITLRAYITGDQLPQVRLGDKVNVIISMAGDSTKTYQGTISWISDKAEFTPKTIQTKEERANLVYAIKIRVKNDGYLKLGMYADVDLNSK
ncbi:MAG TPA: HlyD family efflux transporter periplasmic adaptor subunit [Chitinophagaceae bacterium]